MRYIYCNANNYTLRKFAAIMTPIHEPAETPPLIKNNNFVFPTSEVKRCVVEVCTVCPIKMEFTNKAARNAIFT